MAEQAIAYSPGTEMKTDQVESPASWDQPIMFLSADWSPPFWPLLGIELSSEQQSRVKDAARRVTKDFIGSKESYYYIDFTVERIERTKVMFCRETTKRLPAPVVTRIAKYLDAMMAPTAEERGTQGLMAEAALLLTRDGGKDFPFSLPLSVESLEAAKNCWRQADAWYATASDEAEEACWHSATHWDAYLRSLTELPSALSDFLFSVVQTNGKLPLYWSLICRRLAVPEVKALAIWLRNAASFHGNPERPVVPPKYMGLP